MNASSRWCMLENGSLSSECRAKRLLRRTTVVILFFGPPGCGKGTQSRKITEWLRIPAISTGDLFRAEVAERTSLGLEAREIMARGVLVSDDIVNRMLEKRLSHKDILQGFLLDGYPRTVRQAEFLDHLLDHSGLREPTVLHLDVPRHIILERLSGRRSCPECGSIYNIYSQPPSAGTCDRDGAALEVREDDREEVIRSRLMEYDRLTGPVIRYYEQRDYYRINGNRNSNEVAREIFDHIDGRTVRIRVGQSRAFT